MHFCHWVATFLVAFLAHLYPVSGSSVPSRPLKRLDHPSTLAIEILPRKSSQPSYGRRSFPLDSPTLRHSDTFRLKLFAFGDVFYLHLRPNDHLIHPSARINYYQTATDGRTAVTHTEPLLREAVKAYWGEVIPANASPDRLREDAVGVLLRPGGTSELGWARIVVHHQGDADAGLAPVFEGAFSVNGVTHHVMTKDNYLRNKHQLDPHLTISDSDPDSALVIWRDSDMLSSHELSGANPPARACGHDTLAFNTNPEWNPALRGPTVTPSSPWYDPFGMLDDDNETNGTIAERDDVAGGSTSSNFSTYIGSSSGCPTAEKIVYMGVAADCEYTNHYGGKSNATQQILTDWNAASALYKSTFNVSLGIIELQVQEADCPSVTDTAVPWNIPCSANVSLNDRLSLFSGWRGDKGDDGAGLWHLMSGCATGTEVGIAWLSTLCQQTASGDASSLVSGTAVTTYGRTEWEVVSHEIGHNFGAIHDCTDACGEADSITCCPFSSSSCNAGGTFVMNPVTESGEMNFSPCSLGNICSMMLGNSGGTNTSCLVDPSSSDKLLTLGVCGNGIVEAGEECDPGVGTNSTCCDTTTCQLLPGAACDPASAACCTAQCALAPATQVCRPALDAACDIAEMCTGASADCPADVTAPNGKSCGSGGLACASGQCTSLNLQCQAAGASMNLTTACGGQGSSDRTCQVSCQDPSSANQCVVLQATLLDGSPCGYGGMCSSGSCKAGSILDTIGAWYRSNLAIAIPVTVGAALLLGVLVYLLSRCIRRCRRRGDGAFSSEPGLSGARGQRISSWAHGTPPVLAPPLTPPESRWAPQMRVGGAW